jgi:hypothetical protein
MRQQGQLSKVVLPLQDPQFAKYICECVDQFQPVTEIPQGMSLSQALTESLVELYGYNKTEADSRVYNDEQLFERSRIQTSIRPALNVLRSGSFQFDSAGVEAIKRQVFQGEPSGFIHPQEFVSEFLARNLVMQVDDCGEKITASIDNIGMILKRASINEAFSTNSLCYSTRRDEFYYVSDELNTYFELLAQLDPAHLSAGTALGEHVRELAIKEKPRFLKEGLLGNGVVSLTCFNPEVLASINGATDFVLDLKRIGVQGVDEKTRLYSLQVWINAFIKDKVVKSPQQELDKLQRLVVEGFFNLNDKIGVDAAFVKKAVGAERNESFVSFIDYYRVVDADVYNTLLQGQLLKKANALPAQPAPAPVNKVPSRRI